MSVIKESCNGRITHSCLVLSQTRVGFDNSHITVHKSGPIIHVQIYGSHAWLQTSLLQQHSCQSLGQRLRKESGDGVADVLPLAMEHSGHHLVDHGEGVLDVWDGEGVHGDHCHVHIWSWNKCIARNGELEVDSGPVLTHNTQSGSDGVT